jgi:DNA-binding NarL/FixJ family response regulator
MRVVILTVSEDDRDLFEAIRGGAQGYLLKTTAPEALYESLRGVVRGEPAISGALAARILQHVGARPATPARGDERLTPREQDVLEALASGLTNKEIAGRLSIAENTVKNHLKSILAKLHLENRVQAATAALRRGLVRDHPTGR